MYKLLAGVDNITSNKLSDISSKVKETLTSQDIYM